MSDGRIDDLLDAWFDGVLDASGQAELDALIAADATAARRAASRFDLHRELGDRLRSSSQVLAAASGSMPSTGGDASGAGFRRLRSPGRVRGWARTIALTAAGACVVAAGIWLATPGVDRAGAWLEGRAEVVTDGRPGDGRAIAPGSRIAAGPDAVLRFADGTRLALGEGALVDVLPARGKAMRLHEGAVSARVAPQPDRAPLRITTPHADLTVVGTAFRVEVGSGTTELVVEEGSVRLADAPDGGMVMAGERRVAGVPDGPGPAGPRTVLVPARAEWSYRSDGIAPAAGWDQPGFADAGWSRGEAPLGFDRNESRGIFATVIDPGADRGTAMATWFRREFVIADPATIGRLVVSLRRDDGAVLFLNGVEVARHGMPAGPIAAETRAQRDRDAHQQRVHVLELPTAALRSGANCLGVQVHQVGASSTDLLFALELVAEAVPTERRDRP